jgi:hypothetical protein
MDKQYEIRLPDGRVATYIPAEPRTASSPDAILAARNNEACRAAEAAKFAAARTQCEAEEAARAKDAADRRRAEQQAASAALEADLRTRFFAANSAATEADFRRLLPTMRDAELVRRAEAARDRELDAQLAKYGSMF